MTCMSLRKRITSLVVTAALLVSCGAPDDPTNPGVGDQTNTTGQETPTTAGY
jgi:hypothetical protein